MKQFDSYTYITDSRHAENSAQNNVFIALQTERNDGHRYIPEMYQRGCRFFLVSDTYEVPDNMSDAEFHAVPDPLEWLQKAACAVAAEIPGKVITITGSRGKTVVKELLYMLASRAGIKVSRSPRSYNSHLGVPLAILNRDPEADVTIFEAGVSKRGEMEKLQSIIHPKTVVITDIDSDHDDGFASREEKMREKLLLASGATRLYLNGKDERLLEIAREMQMQGALLPYLQIIDTSTFLHLLPDTLKQWEANDRAAVLAVAINELRIPRQRAVELISTLPIVEARVQMAEGVNDCVIATDRFTPDLQSLEPALNYVHNRLTPDKSLTLILEELYGPEGASADAYQHLLHICRNNRVKRLIGVGPEIFRLLPDSCEGLEIERYSTTEEAMAELSPSDFNHELVMVNCFGKLAPLARMLMTRTHETTLEVDLEALVSNFNFFRSKLKPETGIVAMVKASAYGAGSLETAKTLANHGAAYLAVAVLDEGVELREHGIAMPIMILNPKVLNYPRLFQYNLEPEIYSFDMLREIISEARKAGRTEYPVHIKLDTGMHRLGFTEADIDGIIDIALSQNYVKISSVFSHLATADCLDMDNYTLGQLELFQRCSQKIVDAMPYRVKRHILNTAGILRFPEYQYDMARLGIGLYGIPVLGNGMEDALRPVSALRTAILDIKHYPAGTAIGYGRRSITEKESVIATIPVGYADGINRHLGRGNAKFVVNGVKCPTIGNICMDICMIDVTEVPGVKPGDWVEIFGPENPVLSIAETLDTIPYEVLTSVSPRVKRVYLSD